MCSLWQIPCFPLFTTYRAAACLGAIHSNVQIRVQTCARPCVVRASFIMGLLHVVLHVRSICVSLSCVEWQLQTFHLCISSSIDTERNTVCTGAEVSSRLATQEAFNLLRTGSYLRPAAPLKWDRKCFVERRRLSLHKCEAHFEHCFRLTGRFNLLRN